MHGNKSHEKKSSTKVAGIKVYLFTDVELEYTYNFSVILVYFLHKWRHNEPRPQRNLSNFSSSSYSEKMHWGRERE